MDEPTIAGAAATGGGGFLWWFWRLWNDSKENRMQAAKNKDDLANFKLHVSEHYAQKLDINRLETNIMHMLGQIQDNQREGFRDLAAKIDQKQDK